MLTNSSCYLRVLITQLVYCDLPKELILSRTAVLLGWREAVPILALSLSLAPGACWVSMVSLADGWVLTIWVRGRRVDVLRFLCL
jgi:hypothetical protein